MCSLCGLPLAKNHKFGPILTFLGAPVPTMWCAIADPRHTVMCQISSRSVYSVALCWRKKPRFCRFFGLRHLVLSPISNSLTKLNTGTQLKTFTYPTASTSFLYSNAFMAKSGAQTLTFKSVTDKQTNRQTDRQTDKKLNVFGHPGGG